jgi:hypothetical protein
MRWFKARGGAGRPRRSLRVATIAAISLVALVVPAGSSAASSHGVKPNKSGMLDCNGLSPIQQTLRAGMVCSDPRSIYDGKGTRFEDNGTYIGHDEPDLRFMSSAPGSGNDVTWNETLPRDPRALPTVKTPGKDVTHWFELSVAPWFSMALCNPKSYPLNPCKPRSDSNAPRHPPTFDKGGGGSSFLEVQFYPPGFAPFVDNISCDNTHWCASLHINDLECTIGFASCNSNCEEPTNFAFIQRDGVPTGPPSPQLSNLATATPNGETLLMNPGDRLRVHIFDAKLSGGGHALRVRVDDLTTGQSGFMTASARNGYMATSIKDCSGTPFNYQPEYSTAKFANIVPWAALETNISTEYEIGHFEPCNRVKDPVNTGIDTVWQTCVGPYETDTTSDPTNPEVSDAPCFPKGDTHGALDAPPNLVSGCLAADLDSDGTSYRSDWPNKLTTGPFPSPFRQLNPQSRGRDYTLQMLQTDAAASEASCMSDGSGCAVPAPGSPGNFYPFWTQAGVAGECVWEFGQMKNGNSFGGTAQYGGPSAYFFGNLEGPVTRTTHC